MDNSNLAALEANYQKMGGSKAPTTNKKKSWITSLIPAAGSILGGIAGSFAAPGVGTAAGGAAGGVLGKKLQDLVTGNHSSIASYLGEGALGSLGGLGKGVEAISGASKAVRAGEGLAEAGNVLRYGTKGAQAIGDLAEGANVGTKALEANAVNTAERTGLRGRVAEKAATSGDKAIMAQAGGLEKPTADALIKNTRNMQSLGYNNLEKMAADAEHITGADGVLNVQKNIIYTKAKPINTSGFGGVIADTAAEHGNLIGPAEKKAITQVQKIADKYGFEGGKDGLGVSSASNVKSALKEIQDLAYAKGSAGTPVGDFYGSVSNKLKDTLAAAAKDVPITDAMKKEWITALKAKGVDSPGVVKAIQKATTGGDLAKIEAPFVTASKAATQTARAGLTAGSGITAIQQPTLMGVADKIVGTPIRSGVSKGAGLVSRIAGATPDAATTAGELAAQTAKGMVKAQAIPRLLELGSSATPQDSSAQLDESGQPVTDANALPDPGTDVTDINATDIGGGEDQVAQIQKGLQAAALKALSSGDTKGLDNIVKVASLLESMQPKEDKVSAAQQKQIADAQTALSSLDYLQSQLGNNGAAQGPVKGLLARIPGAGQYLNKEGAAYDATKIEIATSLARAITGSSRPGQQVIDNYMHSLPKSTDSPEFAREKLVKLRAELTNKLGTAGNYPSSEDDISNILGDLVGAGA